MTAPRYVSEKEAGFGQGAPLSTPSSSAPQQ